MNRSRSHDEAVIEMIRNDPEFAEVYLHTAFEELDEEGHPRHRSVFCCDSIKYKQSVQGNENTLFVFLGCQL